MGRYSQPHALEMAIRAAGWEFIIPKISSSLLRSFPSRWVARRRCLKVAVDNELSDPANLSAPVGPPGGKCMASEVVVDVNANIGRPRAVC